MKSIIVLGLCVSSILSVPSLERKPLPIQRFPGGRTIGRQLVAEGKFPYQVVVYSQTIYGTTFCSGALLASNWVLTAGHCTYDAILFTLRLGSNSLVDDDPNRVTVAASYSVVHPDYNPDNLENDIGLIRIDTPYETNDHISTIPIAVNELGADVVVIVSGWRASGDLEGIELKSISNADCKAIFGEGAIGPITDGVVCAVEPGNEGICTGDSGGPMVVDDGNGKFVHVGIVSWATASGCETNHVSVYTRTAHYADWIRSVMG